MSKILTGKLSASVEHPIVCKTIQKSTDLEQYHGEFVSFLSLFFSFLRLTSLIPCQTWTPSPIIKLFLLGDQEHNIAFSVEMSLFMHIYIHVMSSLPVFNLHVPCALSLLPGSWKSFWLHVFFASISEVNMAGHPKDYCIITCFKSFMLNRTKHLSQVILCFQFLFSAGESRVPP